MPHRDAARPPPSGASPQRGPRHRGQLTEVSLSTATDESPKGLQGDGRHSAQSDQTQQHTQTTRQHTHTHTPSRPENARKTRTRCISIMARTRCNSIMARLMAWSNAFITFERPSPPPTPWRRNRAQRCAGTRGHDEPSQLNPAMLVPGRSTRGSSPRGQQANSAAAVDAAAAARAAAAAVEEPENARTRCISINARTRRISRSHEELGRELRLAVVEAALPGLECPAQQGGGGGGGEAHRRDL